jgi:hypothetical protein
MMLPRSKDPTWNALVRHGPKEALELVGRRKGTMEAGIGRGKDRSGAATSQGEDRSFGSFGSGICGGGARVIAAGLSVKATVWERLPTLGGSAPLPAAIPGEWNTVPHPLLPQLR